MEAPNRIIAELAPLIDESIINEIASDPVSVVDPQTRDWMLRVVREQQVGRTIEARGDIIETGPRWDPDLKGCDFLSLPEHQSNIVRAFTAVVCLVQHDRTPMTDAVPGLLGGMYEIDASTIPLADNLLDWVIEELSTASDDPTKRENDDILMCLVGKLVIASMTDCDSETVVRTLSEIDALEEQLYTTDFRFLNAPPKAGTPWIRDYCLAHSCARPHWDKAADRWLKSPPARWSERSRTRTNVLADMICGG